jgi:hypothetical protein
LEGIVEITFTELVVLAFVAAVPVSAIVGLVYWLKTSIVREVRDSKNT